MKIRFCRIKTTIFFLLTALFLTISQVNSDELLDDGVILASLQKGRINNQLLTFKPSKEVEIASFCGACSNSDHGACGGQSNGWSCCSSGCSDSKMQCWNVVSCDKISDLNFTPQQQNKSNMTIIANSHCSNWYSNIQAKVNRYNSECSGTLDEAQYDYCRNRGNQLESEIASYNSQCG